VQPPQTSCSCSLVALCAFWCAVNGTPSAASARDHAHLDLRPKIVESTSLWGADTPLQKYTLSAALLRAPDLFAPPQRRNLHLEVTPLLDSLLTVVRQVGIPVEPIHGAAAGRVLGVSASFRVREDLPAVTIYARQRSPELFGAFYPTRRGVSWAAVWPVRRVTLRLQGGSDSELGYFAVGGVEWRHPERPLAIGLGVPMNLRGRGGGVGGVVVFRMKFH
jgi:hypothetical protein